MKAIFFNGFISAHNEGNLCKKNSRGVRKIEPLASSAAPVL